MSINQTFILILNYNSSADTIELYHQLREFHNGLNIIVIDNKSDEKEKELLKKNIDSDIIIFNKNNYGYAEGNNIGIRKALKEGAKYIWILNPDIRIEKATLPILLETLQNDSKIAAIGPRICFRNEKDKIYSDGGLINKDTYNGLHLNTNKKIDEISLDKDIIDISYTNGSAILLNVATIKDIGIFYKGFFLYYEETEWCNRALKNGWTIKTNINAIVYHTSSVKAKYFHYYLTRNRIIFAKIDNLNSKKVKELTGIQLLYELYSSFKKLRFPKRFYLYRLKGYFSGIFHKLKNYNESIRPN